MSTGPVYPNLPAVVPDIHDESALEAPRRGLLERFAFPPGQFKSRRIVRDEAIYWTRYYKLVDDASLAEIKVNHYDEAADNDGAKFSHDMKEYFEYKATLFPRYRREYSSVDPPPLFDSIFERQIDSCFKSDKDVRDIVEDFKNVCKGNFYQKMCGKRLLQWISSASYAAQGLVLAIILALAASLVLALDALASLFLIEQDMARFFLKLSVSAALFFTALRARTLLIGRISQHVEKSMIQHTYWTYSSLLLLHVPLPFLLLLAATEPARSALGIALANDVALGIAHGTVVGIALVIATHFACKSLLRKCDQTVSVPIEAMNDLLHKRFNDLTDSSAAFFVNSMQKRLHQLHLVTSHLDKRIDFEENLPDRGRRNWGSRAKIWTKVIILAAKRVEYIEKHIQLEMWRVRMAHWSYHRVSDFLAKVVVPYCAFFLALAGVTCIWWIFVAFALVWSRTSVFHLGALAAIPLFGIVVILLRLLVCAISYPTTFLRMLAPELGPWLLGSKSVDEISLAKLDQLELPRLPSTKRLAFLFFVTSPTAWLVGELYFAFHEPLSLVIAITPLIPSFGLPWVALYVLLVTILNRIAKESEQTKGRWQTDINFLNSRIDSSKWEKFTDLRLPQLLGRQVERDKHKINELKSRNRPEAAT